MWRVFQLRIEAVVTVVRNTTFSAGTTIPLSALLNVNGSDIDTQTLTLTLTDTVDNIEYLSLEVSLV